MLNLRKEDILELFKKETDDFIRQNYSTKGMKEMYYVLTGNETKKNKNEIIRSIRLRVKG